MTDEIMQYADADTSKKFPRSDWALISSEPEIGATATRHATREADAIVSRALELGVTLIDTAEIYGFEAGRLVRQGCCPASTIAGTGPETRSGPVIRFSCRRISTAPET
jgi:hypothetical protein